jgi:aryl-alcohol dehydrogenase
LGVFKLGSIELDAPLEFLGPPRCGVQTAAGAVLNLIKPAPRESIVVFRAGSAGLAGLLAERLAGCGAIIAVDIRLNRLQLARSLGPTHSVDNPQMGAVAAIREIIGSGAHCCAGGLGGAGGIPPGRRLTLMCGTCVLVGSAEQSAGPFHPASGRSLLSPAASRSNRLATFYDFAAINQAADAVDGTAIKQLLRIPQ